MNSTYCSRDPLDSVFRCVLQLPQKLVNSITFTKGAHRLSIYISVDL
jgi:hypothetical protein